jgi:hypothetical protein
MEFHLKEVNNAIRTVLGCLHSHPEFPSNRGFAMTFVKKLESRILDSLRDRELDASEGALYCDAQMYVQSMDGVKMAVRRMLGWASTEGGLLNDNERRQLGGIILELDTLEGGGSASCFAVE